MANFVVAKKESNYNLVLIASKIARLPEAPFILDNPILLALPT